MRVDFPEGRNGGSTMASAKRPVLLDASRSKSKNPRGTTELFKLGQFPNMVSRDTKNGQETAEVERLDGGLKGVEGPGSLRLAGGVELHCCLQGCFELLPSCEVSGRGTRTGHFGRAKRSSRGILLRATRAFTLVCDEGNSNRTRRLV